MDEADQGHLGQHTRAAAAPAAPGGADPASGEAEDAALVEGSPDALSLDVLGAAAELVAVQRRARGRPEGSANKRNADMLRYLQSLGHRDPLVTLSMIQTADVKALAKALVCKRVEVLKIQQAAATAMLPYLYAKKPQQLDLIGDGKQRPLMVIGEMNVQQFNMGDGSMSAGEAPPMKVVDNQPLSDAPSVRGEGASSHDGE